MAKNNCFNCGLEYIHYWDLHMNNVNYIRNHNFVCEVSPTSV